jgi:pimeloyl-ACP methyl ester carboxylesterase
MTKTLIAALACALLVPGGALASSPRGTWHGSYSVATSSRTDIAVQLGRDRAIVALGPGHAARSTVSAQIRRKRVTFTVPGRPNLSFSGRPKGKRLLRGTVRQGRARGSFTLTRAPSLPFFSKLGVYGLDGGGTVALLDLREIGLQLWGVEMESSAFHRLYGSGTTRTIGAGFDVRAPAFGKLRTSGVTIEWAGRKANRIPARQLEVRFGSRPTLGGTLTLPAGPGPFPAAAVVHGSGPSERDEGQYMTALLLRRGIAVLAYDKRGNGQSGGRYPGDQATPETVDVLARDAQAAAAFLAAQAEIDTRRIGLVGGSQAGWIIPLAAARLSQTISWALIESGPVVTVGESDYFASLTGQGAAPLPQPIQEIEAQVLRMGPSGFDPAPSLRALRIPVYWTYGGLDRNQPTGLDVPVLERLRAETGADYTWRVFPNGDHGLFEVQTGLLSERRASRGLSPEFVPSIDAWLRAHGLGR